MDNHKYNAEYPEITQSDLDDQLQDYEESVKMDEALSQTPAIVREELRRCHREICHLHDFVYAQGIGEMADKYLAETADSEVPFE